MIPKVIHYCWFGGKKLPTSAVVCIESWKRFFPDYEIIEWNESNYDVNRIPYTSIAYQAQKYAFVSDYARLDILYNHGGIYFDTDVEVVKSFAHILAQGGYMGEEVDGGGDSRNCLRTIAVAPGLGMAIESGNEMIREIMSFYEKFGMEDYERIIGKGYIVSQTTDCLISHGLLDKKGIQLVEGIYIYPKEYFNPLNAATGVLQKTEHTCSIHRFTATWLPRHKRVVSRCTQICHRIFGVNCFQWLKRNC